MMALLDKLAERIEARAKGVAEQTLTLAQAALADLPEIRLHRKDDELVLSGRGLLRRWLTDVRLRFAFWRRA